jgi:putative endonuclease
VTLPQLFSDLHHILGLKSPMPESSKSKPRSALLGQQGERLVAQWLQQQGWSIVAQGWTSRWGELDIVALRDEGRHSCLAFVEVKTRSRGNWDEDGLYAITRTKQAKLWKTAQLFLAKHPHLAEAYCRFDVALVNVRRSPSKTSPNPLAAIVLGQPVVMDGNELMLHTYIESAFELSY